MITVYVPQDQVLSNRPTNFSLTQKPGWATMSITAAQLREWQGFPLTDSKHSDQRQLLHG